MVAGFTGTRKGMSREQKQTLLFCLEEDDFKELHHGDCVGADHQAGMVAKRLGMRIVIYPGPSHNPKIRAFSFHHEAKPPEHYLVRNRHIVDACDVLFAAPETPNEVVRSGTWATIRYARKIGKEIILL